jgi:membrane associated rhomboid family serine protease
MTTVSKIVFLNVLIFGLTYLLQTQGIFLNNLLALYPISSDHFFGYQLISHLFAHSSFEHLFSNMLLLFLFSSKIENKLSDSEVWKFFIFSGLLSSGLYCLFSQRPIIGASGCVFAFMSFYLLNNPIKNFFSYKGIINIFVNLFIILSFLIEIWDCIFAQDDIAHLCHIFGFCFGIFYHFLYKDKFVHQ